MLVLPALLVILGQTMKGHHHQPMEPLPPEERPILKGGAVFEKEAFQETAPVQGGRFLQLVDSGLVCLHQRPERRHVEPAVAGRVELDRVAGDQKERRRGVTVTDRLAQVGQSIAQILAGRSIRPIGPQQPGQYVTAV